MWISVRCRTRGEARVFLESDTAALGLSWRVRSVACESSQKCASGITLLRQSKQQLVCRWYSGRLQAWTWQEGKGCIRSEHASEPEAEKCVTVAIVVSKGKLFASCRVNMGLPLSDVFVFSCLFKSPLMTANGHQRDGTLGQLRKRRGHSCHHSPV